jgi:hypothetical protein
MVVGVENKDRKNYYLLNFSTPSIDKSILPFLPKKLFGKSVDIVSVQIRKFGRKN